MVGIARLTMAGPWRATSVALLAALLPVIGWFSGAVITLVVLQVGIRQGLRVAATAGAIGVALIALLSGGQFGPAVVPFLLWIPTLLIAAYLRYTGQLTGAIRLATGIGMLVVVGFYGVLADPTVFWENLIQERFGPLLEQSDPNVDWESFTQAVAELMTGVVGSFLVVALILGTLLGRLGHIGLLDEAAQGGGTLPPSATGPGQAFNTIRLDQRTTLLTLAVVAGALATQATVFVHLVMVLVAGFWFAGLALTHGIVNQSGLSRGWLIALYVLHGIGLFEMMTLLAMLALVDSWADFRGRLRRGRGE